MGESAEQRITERRNVAVEKRFFEQDVERVVHRWIHVSGTDKRAQNPRSALVDACIEHVGHRGHDMNNPRELLRRTGQGSKRWGLSFEYEMWENRGQFGLTPR